MNLEFREGLLRPMVNNIQLLNQSLERFRGFLFVAEQTIIRQQQVYAKSDNPNLQLIMILSYNSSGS